MTRALALALALCAAGPAIALDTREATCGADGLTWPARIDGSRTECYMSDRPSTSNRPSWFKQVVFWLRGIAKEGVAEPPSPDQR